MVKTGPVWVVMISAVLLASCNGRPGAAERPPGGARTQLTGDYLRLQGAWEVVYNELKRKPTPELHGSLFIFRQDRFRLGDDPPGDERYVLDETWNPKWIDFDDGRPPRILGIYALEGDRLTICTGGPGEARPTAFETSRSAGTVLTRLVRR